MINEYSQMTTLNGQIKKKGTKKIAKKLEHEANK